MRTQRILALDLGRFALKGIAAERADSKWVVTRVALLEPPPAGGPEAALKQLLGKMPRDRWTEVVSVVDDPFLTLRQLSIPPMPEGERRGAVQWEIHSALSLPPEEIILDFEPLGETEGPQKKVRLLAGAAPASVIQQHLSLLGGAGLQPTHLIPRGAAIAAWFRHLRPAPEGPVALLDLGGFSCEFLVIEGKELLFSRKIPVAGSDFTKGITAALMTPQGQVSLSETDAEALKRRIGIPQTDLAEAGLKGISGVQLLGLIRGPLERLALEVERSMAFYGETTGRPAVTELILVGGGAHLKGLPSWLKERLRIPVTVPDPLQGISHLPAALEGLAAGQSLSLVPAIGACLSAGSGMNLLPAEVKAAAKSRVKRAALTGIWTAAILAVALIRIGIGVAQLSVDRQTAALRVEREALSGQISQAKAALEIQEEQRQQPLWEEAFKELSQVLPPEVYLQELDLDGRQLLLRGRVRELGRPADSILPELMRALGEGLFTQVRLNSTRRREDESRETEFEIRCLLR
ncbi:MAG: pilus assembly protein PilM [Candidatus Omnitrophica bacterium]|nr:pilus assembly protein PilM [Candidatus Omnitrophota bacterium]